MKAEYFDGAKESFKMAELTSFIKTIQDFRQLSADDDDLAKAMSGAKI
jgi:hypothetical protein